MVDILVRYFPRLNKDSEDKEEEEQKGPIHIEVQEVESEEIIIEKSPEET